MIKVDDFYRLKEINNVTSLYSPSFSGIVSGECKGNVWVDNLECPNIALVESTPVGGFAFLGAIRTEEQGEQLKQFLEKELFPMLKSSGVDSFEFSAEQEEVTKFIINTFQHKEIAHEQEFSYQASELVAASRESLPQQYVMHQVDDKFWESLSQNGDGNGDKFKNVHLLKNKIEESWYSSSDFINRSLAFCISYENYIVAVIVGTARFNNTLAIDIETDKAHQNKGLASALTKEFINQCVARGLSAQWDCVESNINSKRLVEKLEFKMIRQQTVYWFDI
jgi:ribosomal protein S18 acetylase RimI-like enzyme